MKKFVLLFFSAATITSCGRFNENHDASTSALSPTSLVVKVSRVSGNCPASLNINGVELSGGGIAGATTRRVTADIKSIAIITRVTSWDNGTAHFAAKLSEKYKNCLAKASGTSEGLKHYFNFDGKGSLAYSAVNVAPDNIDISSTSAFNNQAIVNTFH